MLYVSEAAVRIFSPSDDNYPNSGVQPFEGKLSKNSKSRQWAAILALYNEFGTGGIQFNSQQLTINCWLLTFDFWLWLLIVIVGGVSLPSTPPTITNHQLHWTSQIDKKHIQCSIVSFWNKDFCPRFTAYKLEKHQAKLEPFVALGLVQ